MQGEDGAKGEKGDPASVDGGSGFGAPSDLTSGWYTIATIPAPKDSNNAARAVARFGVRDIHSGHHQALVFYACHMYGRQSSITVLNSCIYSQLAIDGIRIMEGSTYDGALLQIHTTDTGDNALRVFLLGDNFQIDGWELRAFVPDGSDPGGVKNWRNLTNPEVSLDITPIIHGGMMSSGPMYYGKTTQHRVLTENDLLTAEKGEKGDRGSDGAKGDRGSGGAKGERGPNGLNGSDGAKGQKGEEGKNGSQGPGGEAGAKGSKGEIGIKGGLGEIGPRGLQGDKGDKGNTGSQGPQGLQGPRGEGNAISVTPPRNFGNSISALESIELDLSSVVFKGVGGPINWIIAFPDNGFFRFTSGHVYEAGEDLSDSVGCAVILKDNKAYKSSKTNDKAVIGFVSGVHEDSRDSINNKVGRNVRVIGIGDSREWIVNKENREEYIQTVFGCNICNEGGNIEVGDLICTSSKPGYFMRQSQDIVRSYTAGKCMETINFDDSGTAKNVYCIMMCG